ncbi:MAG TPA: hypothetical protein VFN68_17150 [Acidimicrobiales bacterium]|nr:hypothetical protein [Acidimicrobiales bacterium]
MPGAIVGSAASPMIHHPSQVLRSRNGYDLHRTSGSTMGQSGNSGPGTGGLRPVGSPSWHYSPWTTYSAGCPGGHGSHA